MPKAAKNSPFLTKRSSSLNSPEPARILTFSKDERLCSVRHISQLIKDGASYNVAPLKFIYRTVKRPEAIACPAQVLIIAPKRIFKTAPARNNIKRRLRECYRLNKAAFYQGLKEQNLHIHVAVIYNKPLVLPHAEISKALETGLKKVLERLTSASQ